MTIKSELLAIQQGNNNRILHCADVVKWAKSHTKSALHRAFNWDDKAAADAHRLWQARQLIEVYVTSIASGPLLVSLSIDRIAGGGYRSVQDVGKVPDLREIMLQDALADLERVRLRYDRVRELSAVWTEVDTVRQKSGGTRRKKAA